MATQRICILIEDGLDTPVALRQQGKRFTVEYGNHARTGLSYAEAAEELGECIMHSLACAGKLDNE